MGARRAADPPRPDASGDSRRLLAAAEVSLALRGGESLATLVDAVEAAARTAFPDGVPQLFLAEDRAGTVCRWRDGGPGEPGLPPSGSLVEWVLRRQEAVFAPSPRPAPPAPDAEGRDGAAGGGGFFALPLSRGRRPLGVWIVSFPTARVFSRDDRLFARLLGDALSMGLARQHGEQALADAAAHVEQLEARAEEGESLLAQMLSVVAHEMRTPLTCIKAYAETLIDIPEEQWGARTPFLEIINEECDRLGRLLNNALDYSRLESGQRSFHLSTLLPADLLQDVIMTLAPEGKRRGVELRARVPEGFGPVEGDCDLLKQLCINLTGNAIKFSPENGPVDLAVSGDEERWRLTVSDRGPGIPEDQRERIFERFYRVEQDGKKAVPGTGLGLAIARNIAELHGGSVRAEGNPEGGSVFQVDLPRVQRAPQAARDVARELWRRPEVERLLHEGVQVISEVLGAQIISAMLVDPERGDLRIVAALGLDESVFQRRVGYRGGIAGRALAQAAPVLVNDIENDPRFRRPNHPQYNTKSLVCVPLILEGQAVGVINVNNKRSRLPFDEGDLEQLTDIAERLAAAARRSGALAANPGALDEEAAALRAAVLPRHDLLFGGRDAQALAFELARRLGADPAEARRLAGLAGSAAGRRPAEQPEGGIRPAASAHAGVAALPAGGERRRRRRTGRSTAAARSRVAQLGATRQILLGRHEQWDGDGHPLGLKGHGIPLGARILAVVDELRALTQGGAFRPAMGAESALAEVERAAGSRFDPQVVAVLGDLVAEDVTAQSAGGGRRRRGA